MADTPETPSEEEVVDLTKSFEDLEALLKPTESNRSDLWQAWNYLQVYATWGLRLPVDDANFKAQMGADPAEYDFVPPMKQGTTKIRKASKTFLNNVYPNVVKVGSDLKNFANSASGDGGLFQFIRTLLQSDDPSDRDAALSVLNDMQNEIADAQTHARTVTGDLSKFRTDLDDSMGNFKNARIALDRDQKTNKAELDKLQGDPNQEGSLASYRKQRDETKETLSHYRTIMATTGAYAWVGLFGLIAAGSVLGVYGTKVSECLKELDKIDAKLKKADSKLKAAQSAHDILELGDTGLTNAKQYTLTALQKLKIVEDAWTTMSGNIDAIKLKVDAMTRSTDEGEKLANRKVIEWYLNFVAKKWDELSPLLEDLMTDNYITVEAGDKSLSEMAAEIDAAQKAA